MNQSEAGTLERAIRVAGHTPVKKPPYDLVIVSGCTVTMRADYKVRQYFRRMARKYGVTRLILSGCSAVSFESKTVEQLGIEKTFPSNDPEPIIDYLGFGEDDVDDRVTFAGRVRGYVKIQDGCNQFCTYCIVPHVRGRERSTPPNLVIERIKQLEEFGVKEAVLTGVHDGRYRYGDLDLAGLCAEILDKTSIPRIRLSSIEATEISDDLIDILANEPRFAPHLHVPLQAGSDRILDRMGRPYTGVFYSDRVAELAQKVDNIGIGADVIVGFPGETDSDFETTYSIIESSPIGYLHIFRYSPRPGTVAASMTDQVHNETKWERMRALKELDGMIRTRFAESQMGTERVVLVEKVKSGVCSGWTDNYIKANFPSNGCSINNLVSVKPTHYINKVIYCQTRHSI